MKKLLLLVFCLLTTHLYISSAPDEDWAIFFVRGINSNAQDQFPILTAFHEEFPQIPIVIAQIGDGGPQTTNRGLYHQLGDVYWDAKSNPILAGKRVIVIGHSQGGLLARAFIEKYGHMLPFTIDSFLSCAGPHGGQFGLPNSWEEYVDLVIWHGDDLLLKQIASLLGIKNRSIEIENHGSITVETAIRMLAEPTASRDILDPIKTAIAKLIKALIKKDFPLVRVIFYNFVGQDLISVANYWKDPNHKIEYLAFNEFLPYFNNEKDHKDAKQYKANIQKLNYLVMLCALNDPVIKPDCSEVMRFYKWNSRIELDSIFTDTDQYINNLLGLRDLYDSGRLFFEYPAGMGHDCGGNGVIIAMKYLRAIVNGNTP
ncbi:TPA: hypothetical protein DDZ86_05080 [Candidatus Dependentiae bacterium]|nr:MAG: hypothetical protein A2Y17_09885 [Clostridiales bacterium GWF2_38_85]HBL98985.1 hypothetical protein [Candidatus Dependentiae bacterium]